MTLFQAIIGAIVLTMLSACTTTESTRTVSTIRVDENGHYHVDSVTEDHRGKLETTITLGDEFARFVPRRVWLARPVDGVFIGVSNFDDTANRVPSPGHAIGAAFAYSLFRSAAGRRPTGAEHIPLPLRSAKEDKLEFVAELRLDPIDPSWHAAEVNKVLRGLQVGTFEYDPFFDLPKDRMWPYIKREQRLTRAEILRLAREQAQRMRSNGKRPRRLGVFYVATHGLLGPDGQPYLIAADSLPDDPRTWISYQQILDLYAVDPAASYPITMLFLFDTCLTGEVSDNHAAGLQIPNGAMVITAAAPGQYSWQWRQKSELKVHKANRNGRTLVDGASPVDMSSYTTMSVLPVAMGRTLRRMDHACQEHPKNEYGVLTLPDLGNLIVELVPKMATEHKTRNTVVQHANMLVSDMTSAVADYVGMVAEENMDNVLFGIDCKQMKAATSP
jgi:hypothetical protein